jgi:hypothetical protein
MNAPSELTDPRIDRLYSLLPAIYRIRDAEQGFPLQALLRVMAEQVNVVQDNISQLYQNWFIETCEDWAVPYIGDLIDYRPVLDEGEASSSQTMESRRLNRVLVPRREVANTIRYRRRKGALYLLELLANDIAGWPARPVEFYRRLGWTQNLNHLHLKRAKLADLRQVESLELIDGPFDAISHTVDVRRINSHRTVGRYNIPSVGIFVWRLKVYSVTRTRARCEERIGPECFTFSVLGQDTQLFRKPEPESQPTGIAEESNLPIPIRGLSFADHLSAYYGPEKSLAIWAKDWAGYDPDQPVPVSALIPADLSDWERYAPPLNRVAVDPVLGRLVFPASQPPKKGLRVTYHYGFSADIGGGEYNRPSYDPRPPPEDLPQDEKDSWSRIYPVGEKQTLKTINDAVKQWNQDKPVHAVIELTESAVYPGPIEITLGTNQSLQLRAANAIRPIIRLSDQQTDMSNALAIRMAPGSSFTLDGILVTGQPVEVTGPEQESPNDPRAPICPARVTIRHSTLVPGWAIDCDCDPKRPAEPSLELFNVRAKVVIEHSVIGSIQVHENEVKIDPIPIEISDSVLDSTNPKKEAIGAPGYTVAHAIITIKRCTVFGIVEVNAVLLAENSLFDGCVSVAHRQIGCMRFCYVPAGCRTPRRYHCQPDLVVKVVQDTIVDLQTQQTAIASERLRVKPQFNSVRYGKAQYAQLSETCADEIKDGADDESEMGVFHDLFQPQRAANLLARLEEYAPAGMDVGIIYAS